MADVVSLALDNLLAPMTLFFVLGFAAGLARSDLQIPESIGKAMAIYLMLAIGFKGGVAMSVGSAEANLFGAIAAGMLVSFGLPILGYALLRAGTRLDPLDAAAVAAHYGSVSVVTFVTAMGFLDLRGVAYAGYMVAVVALMETPAIITGLALARRADRGGGGAVARRGAGALAREILLNGSIVVLVGAFAIGWLTGEPGMARIEAFVVAPFAGVLCLFLLDMGLVAARQLSAASGLDTRVMMFGLYMPAIGAGIGLAAARLIGLDLGSGVLLAVLSASASYIAVPAAMRLALPRANPAIYLTLSLAVTFPFNVLIGIPLYYAVGQMIGLAAT